MLEAQIGKVKRLDDLRQQQTLKAEQLKQKHLEEYRKVRTAFQTLSKDQNFILVIRHLAKICGFWKTSVVLNETTREVATHSTLINEGRRAVYLDIRRMMTDEIRRQTESRGEEHDIQNDPQ